MSKIFQKILVYLGKTVQFCSCARAFASASVVGFSSLCVKVTFYFIKYLFLLLVPRT